MKQVRTRYSNEFKIKAVELCKQNGNVAATCEELKINQATMWLWMKAFKAGKLVKTNGDTEKQKSKEELEIARLKKELYETKMERDIIKKALGIFSKSDR